MNTRGGEGKGGLVLIEARITDTSAPPGRNAHSPSGRREKEKKGGGGGGNKQTLGGEVERERKERVGESE